MTPEKNPGLRGVIFDFDGTLVNSTIDFVSMKSAVLAVIEMYGLPKGVIDPNAPSADIIIAAWKYMSTVLDKKGLIEFERKIERASSDVEILNVERTTEVPGTTKAIRVLREKGYRTGILTRGSRRYVEAALILSGIPFEQELVVCRDDYSLIEAKPNPIALKRAANRIGLAIEECVYVGDHWMDQDCANSAGMPFIGVLSGHNDRERWKGRNLKMMVDDVAKIVDVIDTFKRV
jgi:HAD superfamily hydrolase (TIGR01549 family)